MGGSIATSFSI